MGEPQHTNYSIKFISLVSLPKSLLNIYIILILCGEKKNCLLVFQFNSFYYGENYLHTIFVEKYASRIKINLVLPKNAMQWKSLHIMKIVFFLFNKPFENPIKGDTVTTAAKYSNMIMKLHHDIMSVNHFEHIFFFQ